MLTLKLAAIHNDHGAKAVVAISGDTLAIVAHVSLVEYPSFAGLAPSYQIDVANLGRIFTGIDDGSPMAVMEFTSESNAFNYISTYFMDEIKEYMESL